MSGTNENDLLTLNQIAFYGKISRQAVYVAIKKGSLKAEKKNNRYLVLRKDFDEYRLNKYSREKRMINGEKVFDLEKGHLSVFYVSRILTEYLKNRFGADVKLFTAQHIYYLLRTGQLKGHKKGGAWVILAEEAEKLLGQEIERNEQQIKFA